MVEPGELFTQLAMNGIFRDFIFGKERKKEEQKKETPQGFNNIDESFTVGGEVYLRQKQGLEDEWYQGKLSVDFDTNYLTVLDRINILIPMYNVAKVVPRGELRLLDYSTYSGDVSLYNCLGLTESAYNNVHFSITERWIIIYHLNDRILIPQTNISTIKLI